MKSSACCITRSRRVARYSVLLVILVHPLTLGWAMQEPTPAAPNNADTHVGPAADSAAIIAANTLQGPGNAAFHLRVSAEIRSLSGKPGEQARIDYWWSPQGTHLDLTAPS